jgi:beta-phosphoglucomutase
MSPTAVLFDFDGVIADTENVHIAAWQRTLLRMGWELTDEAAATSAEIDDRAFLSQVFEARGLEAPDLDGWLQLKSDLAAGLLADAPRVYPGVKQLVSALRAAGIRLGVVTTTLKRNVDVVLGSQGLTGAFEFVIGKDDISTLKPAPDAYFLALIKLRLAAGKVVVLEDSPTGLRAASAAGIKCVAIGHRRPEGEWSAGHSFLGGFLPTSEALGAIGVEGRGHIEARDR